MLSTKHFSDEQKETFEILGTYVTNIYYTHLWESAKMIHNGGKVTSLTEAYRVACMNYTSHFTNIDLFKKTIKDIYEFFQTTSPVAILSYSDWVDKFTKVFIPSDFWSSLNSKNKDQLLAMIVESIVKEFTKYILQQQILQLIIDAHDRKKQEIATRMQDKLLEIQMIEHEKTYQRFMKPALGSSTKVDAGVAEKLKQDLIAESKRSQKMLELLKRTTVVIKEKEQKEIELKNLLQKYIEYTKILKAEIVKLRSYSSLASSSLASSSLASSGLGLGSRSLTNNTSSTHNMSSRNTEPKLKPKSKPELVREEFAMENEEEFAEPFEINTESISNIKPPSPISIVEDDLLQEIESQAVSQIENLIEEPMVPVLNIEYSKSSPSPSSSLSNLSQKIVDDDEQPLTADKIKAMVKARVEQRKIRASTNVNIKNDKLF